MRISWRPIGAIILGVALGLGGAHATFLGAWTLIPWGLVALAFTFMIGVYTGAVPITSKLAGFFVLGVVGAVCGGALAVAASWALGRRASNG